jgi:hypothetical protein
VAITRGQVDWDSPLSAFTARSILGASYEEITIFFLAHPDDVPQWDVH